MGEAQCCIVLKYCDSLKAFASSVVFSIAHIVSF